MSKPTRKNSEQSWFGYRPVDTAPEKTALVRDLFTGVAARYDFMNDLMSLGTHRLWKDRFVAALNPRANEQILDLAGGTGDIAQRILRRTNGKTKVTVCDLNPAMLAQGQARALDSGWHHHITWLTGDAAKLPLPDRSFDAVTIAFGLRNVALIDDALAEAARVLKIGGRFFCLEFSPGVIPVLKQAYDTYSFKILPWLGEVVAHDRAAYQYLAESIRQFPDQPTLAKRMTAAGMDAVRWTNLSGGIAVMHEGWIV